MCSSVKSSPFCVIFSPCMSFITSSFRFLHLHPPLHSVACRPPPHPSFFNFTVCLPSSSSSPLPPPPLPYPAFQKKGPHPGVLTGVSRQRHPFLAPSPSLLSSLGGFWTMANRVTGVCQKTRLTPFEFFMGALWWAALVCLVSCVCLRLSVMSAAAGCVCLCLLKESEKWIT